MLVIIGKNFCCALKFLNNRRFVLQSIVCVLDNGAQLIRLQYLNDRHQQDNQLELLYPNIEDSILYMTYA